jgi:uncharacterized protein
MKRPPFLPDVNLLLALAWAGHPHHAAALRWLAGHRSRPALIGEINAAGFIRLSGNAAVFDPPQSFLASWRWLESFMAKHPGPDPSFSAEARLTFARITPRIQGHGQVADAMLLAIAEAHHATLATFDHRLPHLTAKVHTVEIVPV